MEFYSKKKKLIWHGSKIHEHIRYDPITSIIYF